MADRVSTRAKSAAFHFCYVTGFAGTVGLEPLSINQDIDKPNLFARQPFAFVAGFCIRVKPRETRLRDFESQAKVETKAE
jgi:hypothetical protein